MFEMERTLKKVVSNLWFEWNDDVHLLFKKIDPFVWQLFRRNLYRFLTLQDENPLQFRRRLAELLVDPEFLDLFLKVEKDFKEYMEPRETIVSRQYPELAAKQVAYFSMEYGIDILRIYSGGLGILSGDHLRGASDLGLKMTGVGLLYLHGYYEQQVDLDGTMRVFYESLVPSPGKIEDYVPLEPVRKAGTNQDLIVEVPIRGRKVRVRVWRVHIGRCELLLLDSNLIENNVHDRHITRRLYASQKQHEEERQRRLEQEIVLGIGGVKALMEAGYEPSAYHLNEGHVAFAAIEVIRHLMQRYAMPFDAARARAAQLVGFTTHTPVPEGNERFDERLVRDHLEPYLDGFLSAPERETFFNCARNREDHFDMTKLSLLLSGVFRNGVSALHGEVCRRMWGFAWGKQDPEGHDVPIQSITNSVHVAYWQKPNLRKLLASQGGPSSARGVPDEQIWSLHQEYKTKLIEKARERYAFQLLREKADPRTIHEKTRDLLDLDSFMIGFARRFADYKRVTMLLDDEERLFQFLEKAYKKYGKPVHILYSGKPHPNNHSGRGRIRQIVDIAGRLEARARERGFRSHLIFLQGYDIDLARYLVAGVDIWLNNPIRPLEASGTSGMKAGMNGVLNVSISDGWVPEGVVSGENGWLFGRGDAQSAESDRQELFRLLEETILPVYFDRNGAGLSPKWIGMMKNSIETITRAFNTDRMLSEYSERMYLPAVRNAAQPIPEPSVQR